MEATQLPPTIALVGRPNVGKSTLFNRLAGGRRALVAATPGLTRDRRIEDVTFEGYRFFLVDTGGMAFEQEGTFSEAVAEQVAFGVEDASCVWLVMDATEGLNPFDHELYRWLLRRHKPVFLIVNKADNASRRAELGDFYALGSDALLAVSALHGTGISEALEATAAVLPELHAPPADDMAEEGRAIRILFLGRPNVGKSSLLNCVLGEGRMIVSEQAGTTREAVDVEFCREGRIYKLIDSAGIRRRAKTKDYLEKIGVISSLGALRRTDVAVLVVDAAEAISEQDARIASYILEQRRGIVVALNKWDRVEGDPERKSQCEEGFSRKLGFLAFAPRVQTSALHGTGIDRLFKEIQAVQQNFCRRIQTADLNRVLQMAALRQAPPARGRVPTKVFYGSQIRARPPTFCLFTNHPAEIKEPYTRYMEKQLRYHFGLKGTPLNIVWKGRRDEAGGGTAGKGRSRRK
jgi:GTP-binding protein